MGDTNSTPDLQTILANLARFAPAAASHATDSVVNKDDALNPPSVGSVSNEHEAKQSARDSRDLEGSDPRFKPQTRSTASPKPVIDPATITTWQDGLRCVTKIAAQNVQFAASIRKMMEDQRRNEMRWYAERQALKQAQANRAKSSQEAQSILRSLSNGGSTANPNDTTPTDIEAELARFDRKIYDAQLHMNFTMTAELKGLGVPFFGTDQSLILDDRGSTAEKGERPKWSPLVSQTQLLGLQRRMVEYLEDLYRD